MALNNLSGMLDVLASQELLLGAFLATAGLVFMLFGFRVSAPLIAISFGVLGFVLCASLPLPDEARLAASLVGGLALGVCSTYFTRLSIAILGGAWSGYVAFLLAGSFEIPQEAVWTVGGLGLIGGASMALVAHREMIAFVLSLEGAVLCVGALVIFSNQNPTLWSHLRGMLLSNPIFAPFLLLSGTVTGFYWQLAELRQRDSGMSA